jgi:AcrR family transcriptional regulator
MLARVSSLPRGAAAAPADLRADAARNRDRILAIARQQVGTGDLTLPMNAIARQAGVGVGTIYRHFPTRQALLEGLAAASFAELAAEAEHAAAAPVPGDGLQWLLTVALRCQARDAALAAVLETAGFHSPQTLALGDRLGGAMATLLSRAREAGAIRPDIGPDDIRRLTCGLATALRNSIDTEQDLHRYVGVLVAGLKPEPVGGPGVSGPGVSGPGKEKEREGDTLPSTLNI